ncbi:MAG: two-component system chemotaxis response regulator CheB [Alteromonadaceae bacterium]|jgi:two-component system chemotaxis response regulator CheB
MAYKVLVVDDSSFFRRRVTDILNNDPKLTVIDVAVNGIDAVEKAKTLKPDVITMDIEMPLLNGIEAVKQIMASAPTAILMFSSLTHQGAKATLEALDAGALDFLPKKFNEIAKTTEDAGLLLRQRVLQLARKRSVGMRQVSSDSNGKRASSYTSLPIKRNVTLTSPLTQSTAASSQTATAEQKLVLPENKTYQVLSKPLKRSSGKKYKLLAIGTSTGGPVALQKILTKLPSDFPIPIILVQHMPATFTHAFASRLNSLCKISVKEASDGDVLKPGCAYLAPGGRQMILSGNENVTTLKVIEDNSTRIAFKPSVDISFGSAAKIFKNSVLGIILTGMGSDGKEGARMLKNSGATIWAQDEESCVVYGMPQVVTKAGISELSLSIDDMTPSILKEIVHG